MITDELLSKVRRDHTGLLSRVTALTQRAEQEGTLPLAHEIGALERELRDYVGLVDAIIDALSPDAPQRHKRTG